MMMTCIPSQVMREGRDLNQQGQAGRQEQASSSSPEIFHEVFFSEAARVESGKTEIARAVAMPMPNIPDLSVVAFIRSFLVFTFDVLERFLVDRKRTYSRQRTRQHGSESAWDGSGAIHEAVGHDVRSVEKRGVPRWKGLVTSSTTKKPFMNRPWERLTPPAERGIGRSATNPPLARLGTSNYIRLRSLPYQLAGFSRPEPRSAVLVFYYFHHKLWI